MKQTTTLDFGVKPIFHVGVSGGKDSTALLLWPHAFGVKGCKKQETFA